MGEAKRRKRGGTYPTGEAVADYPEYRNRLRGLFPDMPESEIGRAWMRIKWAGRNDVPGGKPEDIPVLPGSVVVHLIGDNIAALNGAVRVEHLDKVIAMHQATGLSREQACEMIWVTLVAAQQTDKRVASKLLNTAVGLAFTSTRAHEFWALAKRGYLRLTYHITTPVDAYGRTLNFRLTATDQRDPPLIVPLDEMPPPVRSL